MKTSLLLGGLLLAVSASANPVKIGAVYCNSGPQQALDEPSWRGAQVAVAARNRSGGINGRPVELVRIAAESTPAAVAAAVRAALQSHPDMAALVGLSDSNLPLAAGREARRAGKVFVTSGATSPLLPNQVGGGFFLACFGDNVQAAAAAEWLRAQGAKRVAVMHDRTKIYTRLLSRYFAEAFAQAGGTVVDHTTASANVARELAALAKGQGQHFIDAPVSGGEAGAVNGLLTVMCGGDAAVFDRVKPVAMAFSRAFTLMGETGAGQLTKMVNQICIAGLVQGLSEAVAFGQKAGLNMELVLDVIGKGAAQSWQMDNRGKTMVKDQFNFGFAVDWMRKDLGLVLDEANRNGARLPVTALVDQFYADVQQMGGQRWDTSSLIKRLR